MKFEEEIARKLIAEHGLNETTFRVWKTRNVIPDKYLRKNFTVVKDLSDEDQARQKKLLEVLSFPEINAGAFADCVSYTAKINEIKAGKSNFTVLEIEKIELRLKDLRQMILALNRDERRFLDKYQAKQVEILNRPEVVVKVLLTQIGKFTDVEFRKVSSLQYKNILLSDQKLIFRITDVLMLLYVRLQGNKVN